MAIKENLSNPPSTSADSGSLGASDAWGSRGSSGAEESSASIPLSVKKGIRHQERCNTAGRWIGKKSEMDPKTKHHLQHISVGTCVPNSVLKKDRHACSF